jgi:acetyl-CoA/propionyl-CoA carboxylase biotin carboxyl carrier protein
MKLAKGEIGFPIAVKASGGGGGKGFRVALEESELEGAFEGAAREGEKFFGDATVYLERYLPDPRHVEVQIIADKHGNTIHLGERDCSIQRRHQKLIEEAPGPHVDEAMRDRIGQASIKAAEAVGYVGAARSRACCSADTGEDFFLEMNTRVQVEHPSRSSSRASTSSRRASAPPRAELCLRQRTSSCAATRSSAASTPRTRRATSPPPRAHRRLQGAHGPGVRVDSGVGAGGEVSPMYDPMVAKLIVWDADREQATGGCCARLASTRSRASGRSSRSTPALLQTEQWARGETARDLLEDKSWLKTLAFPKVEKPADDEEEKVEQEYLVEVSGRRFDVKVIGPPMAAGAVAAGPARRRRRSPGAATARPAVAAAEATRSSPRCRATSGRSSSRPARRSKRARSSRSSRR